MEVMLGIILYSIGGLLVFFLAFMALLYARMPKNETQDFSGEWKRSELMIRMFHQMFKENLSPKNLFNRGKPFWWLSCILFFGTACISVWTLFLIGGSLVSLVGVDVDTHATFLAALFYYPTIPAGVAGFTLTTFGLVVLILRCLNDLSLRRRLFIQDFFDSFLAFGVLLTGLLLWGNDLSFADARSTMAQILSFSQDLQISPLLFIHLVLLDIVIIYIPLSRMISYGNKFFALHRVTFD